MATEKARQKLLDRWTKKSKFSQICGNIVFQELIGQETIRVYAQGFVSVGGVFKEPEPEKLVSIQIDVQTAKKTGLGRAVAAGVTAGLNMLSGNIRGDIYVTIQTEKSTHLVHSQFPTTTEVAELRRLEVIVRQMLSADERLDGTQEIDDVAAQLKHLAELFNSGLLTESEFASGKAKILGQ